MTRIVAEGVFKTFRSIDGKPRHVLQQVDLTFDRGELILLSGPSGAGKSTLLALLAAQDLPTSGRVVIDGRATSDLAESALAELRRRIGFLYQDAVLLPYLSAAENVMQVLIPRGVGLSERRARAMEVLREVGLAEFAEARPSVLSGGERQRLNLARALAGRPETLIADEPTSQLDASSSQRIVALLDQQRAAGVSVLVASHDAAFRAVATRCLRLEDGRLLSN